MVAPVVTDQEKREVYFPEGVYERVFGPAARYSGPNVQTLQVPSDQCPVFLRQGAVIPVIPTGDLGESWSSAFEDRLVWLLFPKGRSAVRYVDGARRFAAEVRENSTSGGGRIEIRIPESAEPVGVVIFGRPAPARIMAEGVEIERVNYIEELKMEQHSAWVLTGEGRAILCLLPPTPPLVIVEE
jgi:hypothetical protein